ncbi:MAG: SGNH/GDSL hydrolase family protein [Woeseiaceae bacterium]|jgi:lysophospholipase L1-like esterase
MMRKLVPVVFVAALFFGRGAAGEVPDPDPGRFADAIAAFAMWDSKNAVPHDPLLFVGSSSIRLWPTARDFPGRPVVNRGFGGAELSDVAHYYERVIRPYAPSRVFLYAGDNDIAAGKSAAQVFEDFRNLADRLARDFPGTELVFISIKPSPARWTVWPTMQEANRLVAEYASGREHLYFADLATPLLDADGRPKDVYVEDGLHLNAAGYALWQAALAPFVAPEVNR